MWNHYKKTKIFFFNNFKHHMGEEKTADIYIDFHSVLNFHIGIHR